MSALIETFTAIYPKQLFLEITPEQIEAASPNNADYSYDVARRHALINRLVLNGFTDWLRTEAPIDEKFNIWPSVEDLPNIWEFVNGSALTIGNTRLVLIPQETMDTDEFSVPQEWVDIPDWVADYYLGVQVNLEQGWLRIWGFISHKSLKQKAKYDPVLRNYSVDGELLIEDLTVMWVARQFEETERAEVMALPKLFGDEFDRISEVLGKPRGYSARLLVTNSEPIDDSEVAFSKWAALMSQDNLRQQLYSKLCVNHYRESHSTSIPSTGKFHSPQEVVYQTFFCGSPNYDDNAEINFYPERFEKLLDVDWVEPEKILVSSGRRGRANVNQPSQEKQSIQLEKAKIIELDNQKFALIIKIEQEKENEQINLFFELLPDGGTTISLPFNLELALLKFSGKVIISDTTKAGDNELVLALQINQSLTKWLEKLESNRKKGKVYQIHITLKGKSRIETFPSIQPVT